MLKLLLRPCGTRELVPMILLRWEVSLQLVEPSKIDYLEVGLSSEVRSGCPWNGLASLMSNNLRSSHDMRAWRS